MFQQLAGSVADTEITGSPGRRQRSTSGLAAKMTTVSCTRSAWANTGRRICSIRVDLPLPTLPTSMVGYCQQLRSSSVRPPGRRTTGSTRPAVGGTVRCSCCPSKRRFIGFVLSFQVFLSYTQRKALPPCPVGKTTQKIKKQKDLFCRIYAVQKRSFCCVPLRGVS